MAESANLKSPKRRTSRPKSLPPCEIQLLVSSDSGLDSGLDCSPVSSTKFDCDIEEVEKELEISPLSFLLGETEPQKLRIEGVEKALDWLRTELQNMKLKDRQLAKTMISIRSRIQEVKQELEQARDKGYGSDSESPSGKIDETEYKKQQWRLIARDGAFPTDSTCFDGDKRATWVI